MRILSLLPIVAVALAQAPAPDVAVQGIVTDSRNGDPLPSVQIRLVENRPLGQRRATYTVSTGTDGKFRIAVPAGEYTEFVQRPGFFGPPDNTLPQPSVFKMLTLTAAQQLPEQKFSLTPAGVITGRIIDEAGRPAGNMTIAAMQVRYDAGRRFLFRVRAAQTNELGEYRIYWIPPEDYVVMFEPPLNSVANPTLTSGPASSNILTRTYYPGTLQSESARLVQVSPGTELKGIDFALRAIPSFKVSGRVNNPYVPAGGPPAELSALPGFMLVNRDVPDAQEIVMSTFANSATMADRQAGLFELRGIPAGRYDIFAAVRNPAFGVTYSGSTAIDVVSDVKDVVISVRPPVDLAGRIVTTGNARLPEKTVVELWNTGSARVAGSAQSNVDAAGAFAFKSLVEGTYRLSITPPPELFISDIRQGDHSIYNDALVRITGDKPQSLEIVIAPNARSVSGSVAHPQGKSGVDTVVVAIPDGPLKTNLGLYRTRHPDDSGQFSITGLPPGRYKFFAWESAPASAWTNTEFLSRYEDQGLSVNVGAGATTGVRLPVIWRDSPR